MPHVEHIVVAVAMHAEAFPFVQSLKLEQDKDFFPRKLPFIAYKGVIGGSEPLDSEHNNDEDDDDSDDDDDDSESDGDDESDESESSDGHSDESSEARKKRKKKKKKKKEKEKEKKKEKKRKKKEKKERKKEKKRLEKERKQKPPTRITVVCNGKDKVYGTGVDNCGTVPAAMATYLALERVSELHKKESDNKYKRVKTVLVNAGTCGGFKSMGAKIGDVFVTTATAHHDRRIPIPGFDTYGVGRLESFNSSKASGDDNSSEENEDKKKKKKDKKKKDKEKAKAESQDASAEESGFNPAELAEKHGFKLGVCTTGNSLDKTNVDMHFMQQNQASVKDMEAAAIAWTCALQKVPFVGLKVVTDIVDGDIATQDEFLANLMKASQKLQEALPKVIEYIVAAGYPSQKEKDGDHEDE